MIEHLYIHIPFCKKKCPYCNFLSYEGREDQLDAYANYLSNTLTTYMYGQVNDLPLQLPLTTIYFGGGTPSLLTPKQLEKILCGQVYDPPLPEISLEANPATADYVKLKGFREAGVNRLSIGAQSFNDRHLKTLGRIHSSEDVYRIFDDARRAGFDNIGIDIMYALPGQTFDEFKEDINAVLKLNPEHISLYNLEVQAQNFAPLPDNDTEADMYQYAIDKFKEVGYKHYEISNFAKPERECQHNIAYWLNKNYLGIGEGAHSHVDGYRWVAGGEKEAEHGCEKIIMGLRLLEGIAKDNFIGFENEVKELKEQGLLEETAENIKLTHRGLFLANLVFEKFV
ncbi:hypothetical protein A2276_04690 [candidate division WOR-1 bacterium RIFOXYA12_FULL_43_27]|uniref:Heme chaperone HemW n=1 Tax=candidate division WOR-1 bacterium RIFOXYC2_FULL_46_14 TaxID=1802587 RepID=A0A1F4U334_UNCSA|nr:MAG: hypothetical protein A2276_04690 [candidate division WOR-1 bacterium RIFOXYA12_FULL_43_27]OGC18878.1 MAG: hypothetical protein A2292_08145 [candidate division WOR-1 bacterium RIFOXYB2_FULL_46_45]OGC29019.1 MAG: hypothetical protein A2232_03210 [candidate division WOR-1 bacterium RIFOXYA2_FULL_46_56]OGC39277.1 MAG: hypothetical protein A2438_07110 [candidate division WOR-1 bacterium RIFOXYC2_FULL_46_14]